MQAHEMRTEEVFARTIQLLEGPEAPFTRQAQKVAQEALTAERTLNYDAYKHLATDPETAGLVAAALPADDFNQRDLLSDVKNKITTALKQEGLSDQERFRLKTASQGADYARHIRPN